MTKPPIIVLSHILSYQETFIRGDVIAPLSYSPIYFSHIMPTIGTNLLHIILHPLFILCTLCTIKTDHSANTQIKMHSNYHDLDSRDMDLSLAAWSDTCTFTHHHHHNDSIKTNTEKTETESKCDNTNNKDNTVMSHTTHTYFTKLITNSIQGATIFNIMSCDIQRLSNILFIN